MSKDIFIDLAERQGQGVMFHSNMVDYYDFLNLPELAHLHHCQFMKENATFRSIKDYYINHCHKTLRIETPSVKDITPADWDNKTSMDVDKDTLKILTKKSLQQYYDWETETCEIYKSCANRLFDEEYYDGYKFIREIIDDVELEKIHITSLMLDLQAVDYDINAIKGISYKMEY